MQLSPVQQPGSPLQVWRQSLQLSVKIPEGGVHQSSPQTASLWHGHPAGHPGLGCFAVSFAHGIAHVPEVPFVHIQPGPQSAACVQLVFLQIFHVSGHHMPGAGHDASVVHLTTHAPPDVAVPPSSAQDFENQGSVPPPPPELPGSSNCAPAQVAHDGALSGWELSLPTRNTPWSCRTK